MRLGLATAVLVALARVGEANPDPKRKVVVLEYRAGSSALPGVAGRIVSALAKQTSLEVLGPDQTRAVYGEHLDQAVVKCEGGAECIARIGGKVGAAEVILVGVSELGDVILTMQRIDVASQTVSTRIADSLAINTTPSDDAVNGYLGRLMPASDFLRFGVIDIIANQVDASVTVAGEKRGTTPIKPLTLHAPATYTVRVEKDGYTPFTTTIDLPPDGRLKVEADLSPITERAWYQHWYVLAGAGILAAALAGTTIYIVTRRHATQVPINGMTN
jgi:hypothetical protein